VYPSAARAGSPTARSGGRGARSPRPLSATGDTSGLADCHRPVLTSLRICKSCRQALNGNRERSMQETAHHRDQPDKDREYLRPPRAPQVPFAAATAHDHAQARIGVMVTSPSRPGLH
jgi:hypothetical protein